MRTRRLTGISPRLLVLVLCTGFVWEAAVKIAMAEHFHVSSQLTVTFSSSDLAPETVEAASALLTPLQHLLARAAP